MFEPVARDRLAIAPPHADIPTAEVAPAIDIHSNPRTPITSEAVRASVDIYIDVGATFVPRREPGRRQ
jgi:hypothetical protein